MNKKRVMALCILVFSIILTGCKKEITVPEPETITGQETVEPVKPSVETITEINTETEEKSTLANTMNKENYPKVDGSTATIPLSQAIYQLATGATKEAAESAIVHTKTSNSYNRLIKGEVDLLLVYEPSKEVEQSMEESGVKLIKKPIGKDALIFMANASNPVNTLTKEQLIGIYSGKIKNWKTVGGEDKDILAFQRPADSGSQTLMQKLVMGDTKMMTGPNVISYESMEGILKAMADYTGDGNTLGYSVYYYAKNMYERPELKFMAVSGIEPTLESIYDNSYPFINEFYAVIREDEPVDSNAHKIFDWITGEEGQTLVKELGYVPVKMGISENSSQSDAQVEDSIPEGYGYITASYSSHNDLYVGDVTIYNNNWKTVRSFKNAYVSGNIGLVKEDSYIPLGYGKEMEDGGFKVIYGIYSIAEDKFVLDARYDSIYILDEKKGYYVVSDSTGNKVIDLKGHVYASGFLQQEGYGVSKKGDYYWIYDYSQVEGKDKYSIYNSDFKLIKEFYHDYEDVTLYDNDGSEYFSKEMLMKQFGIKNKSNTTVELPSYNNGDTLINVYYNGVNMILDRNLNVLAKKPVDEQYNSFYNIYDNIFSDAQLNTVDYISSGTFYDNDGEKILDEKGNSYDNIISGNFYGYTETDEEERSQILYHIENNLLNIFNYNSGKHLEIDLGDWDKLSYIYCYKDLVVLFNDDDQNSKTRIYKNNTMLTELSGWYALGYTQGEGVKNSILLQSYGNGRNDNGYLLMDEEGNTVYQSKVKEGILSLDRKYMQVVRGNYLYVTNFDGDIIIKNLNNALDSD